MQGFEYPKDPHVRRHGPGGYQDYEHFVPVASDPSGTLEYANLLYACATCNEANRDLAAILDPCRVAFADCVRINEDGKAEALNDAGASLVKKLRLNSDKNLEYRSRWMRILVTLQLSNPDLYRECMSFPSNLPDLRTKRAPSNSRPDSVGDCWFAQRERGTLPPTY